MSRPQPLNGKKHDGAMSHFAEDSFLSKELSEEVFEYILSLKVSPIFIQFKK